jgi:hypothetical protein
MHVSGQWVKSSILLNPVKNDPQQMGSAITYMRRFSLMSALGIVGINDDDDGASASGTEAPKPKVQPPTQKQVVAEKKDTQSGFDDFSFP